MSTWKCAVRDFQFTEHWNIKTQQKQSVLSTILTHKLPPSTGGIVPSISKGNTKSKLLLVNISILSKKKKTQQKTLAVLSSFLVAILSGFQPSDFIWLHPIHIWELKQTSSSSEPFFLIRRICALARTALFLKILLLGEFLLYRATMLAWTSEQLHFHRRIGTYDWSYSPTSKKRETERCEIMVINSTRATEETHKEAGVSYAVKH